VRTYARVVAATVAVLSGIAIAGMASASKVRNCDGCLVGVAADGSMLGSRGAVSSKRLAVGYYEVAFKRTISGCAISATQVILNNNDYPASYVSAEIPPGAPPNVLRYYIVSLSGANDSAFTSTLVCI
jgi:hypothetical protein